MQDTLGVRAYARTGASMRTYVWLLRSHVLHGEKGGGGWQVEAVDEWMNLKTVVSVAHSRNRERAFEGRAFFFEEKPHCFSLPSPFSSSPSFLRIVRASWSRLNERFVIRSFAEVACACMSRVMLCRFVFRLSRFSSFLSFPLHLPRLPSLRILSSFDFPWLFFFSLSRLFHAIANIGSLSASGWSGNCTGYQKLWHCARKIKKIFGEKRRDQRASAGTNLLTKVRFLMGISHGFFISRIKVAKCVENCV